MSHERCNPLYTKNNSKIELCLPGFFCYSCFIYIADPPDIDEGPFIPQPPTIIPGDMTVMIGTPTYVIDGFDITLVCNIASGTRPITIRWIRNGASYPAGGNRSTITVPDTDYNDGDDFTCRADNIVGFDEETTMINVFGKVTHIEKQGCYNLVVHNLYWAVLDKGQANFTTAVPY